MRIDILSLFPEYFESPFNVSMLKRAREAGLLDIRQVDIRDFSEDRHNRADDRPYGGGPGMVLMPGPVVRAIRSVKEEDAKVVYLSPQGKTLTAAKCRELALCPHLILLCGHYEGVDERALTLEVDEEISIGDYVLTSGAPAAVVVVDAVARFIPGVVGDAQSIEEDSFEGGMLDYPHYTRPEEFEGIKVPDALLGGNHKKIADWRRERALEKTRVNRPDLLQYSTGEEK